MIEKNTWVDTFWKNSKNTDGKLRTTTMRNPLMETVPVKVVGLMCLYREIERLKDKLREAGLEAE